jgi:hypothetical protein
MAMTSAADLPGGGGVPTMVQRRLDGGDCSSGRNDLLQSAWEKRWSGFLHKKHKATECLRGREGFDGKLRTGRSSGDGRRALFLCIRAPDTVT